MKIWIQYEGSLIKAQTYQTSIHGLELFSFMVLIVF